MPFTLAHPAAVVPLFNPLRRITVPAALVIGSITPDLAYFIPLPINELHSHSPAGLLWYCLPMGLLALGLFFFLMAPLICMIAPAGLAARLPTEWHDGRIPKQPLAAVAFSLVLGAATHDLWDAFTHAHGACVQVLPVLKHEIFEWGGYRVYVYKLLQHGSTLLGLGLLLNWGRAWYRAAPTRMYTHQLHAIHRILLAIAILLPAMIFGIASGVTAIMQSSDAGSVELLRAFVGNAIFTSGPLLLGCAFLIAMAIKFTKESRRAQR